MTEFDERLEGEMKSHEKEMLRKVLAAKYGKKDLSERIQYIKTTFPRTTWTAEEMLDSLADHGLDGSATIEDIRKALTQ